MVDLLAVDAHLPGTTSDGATAGAPSGTSAGSSQAGSTADDLQTQTVLRTATGVLPVPDRLARGLHRGQRMRATTGTSGRYGADGGGAITALTPISGSAAAGYARTSGATWSVTGNHTVTVLPVYWKGASAPSAPSIATLKSLAAKTASYWSQQSAGRITLTSTVKGWQAVTKPSDCDYGSILNLAMQANKLSAPGSNQHVLVYFPTLGSCSWAGLGSIRGPYIWVNGYPLTDVFSHEFGHNLGSGHANARQCFGAGDARVALSTSCADTEYDDGADVMGYTTYATTSGTLNSALADVLGLVATVEPGPGETTVDLAPLTAAGKVRAIKIPVTGGWVYVDYRPAVAPDLRVPSWAGVQAHFRSDDSDDGISSYLLDLRPWTAVAYAKTSASTSMPASSVWRVPLDSGVALSVISTGATAKVRIVRTAGDTVAPSAPSVGYAQTGARTGTLTWTASTDVGSGVAGYRILVNGETAGFAAPEDTSYAVNWASTVDQVRVEAIDAVGNTTASADPLDDASSVQTLAYSTRAGTPVLRTPAAGAVVRTRKVVLTWTPPTGGSLISGYQIYVNGSPDGAIRPATTRTVSLTLAEGRNTVAVATRGVDGKLGSAASRILTVDTKAPVKPAKATLAAGSRTVSWQYGSDPGSRVRFVVRAGGVVVTTTTARSKKLSATQFRKLRAARTATVEAVDQAGNWSGRVVLVK